MSLIESIVSTVKPLRWFQKEDRTPRVVLEANFNYWDTARDARLEKVIFLNDISQKEAIEKVC